MGSDSGYYRFPTIHGDDIVFVSDDDLWSVSTSGGPARRLSASPGGIGRPVLSPDGRFVAFSGRDEGQPEIWVMPAEGGPAVRRTWFGSLTAALGWKPDGSEILVASDAGQPFMGYFHGYTVPPETGTAKPLHLGPLSSISYRPDGPGVVIGRNTGDPARWKRYRGGTAGVLWVDTTGRGSFRKLVDLPGNLAAPMWIGKRIFFLSDHEGIGNLYSVTTTGRSLRRHTHHEEFYARFPQTDGRRIVYSCGADIWLLDPETGENRRVDVKVLSARPQLNRKFVDAAENLQSYAPHPEGHSLVITSRGKVFTFPLWEEAVAPHGPADGVRHRLARYLPGGKKIVAVWDEPGEEELVVFTAGGATRRVRLEIDLGRATALEAAPKGNRVALANHRYEVIVVDLATKKARVADRSRFGRIQGIAWSPDGRWLAYSKRESHNSAAIHVHDTRRNRSFRVTRPDFNDMDPVFDLEGKHLFFISYREFNPVYDHHAFDLGFPRGGRLMAVPLQKNLPSPFVPLPRPPAGGPPNGIRNGKKGGKEEKDVVVKIDLAGIEERVVAFPVPEGTYGRIAPIPGKVLFSSFPVEGSLTDTWAPGGPPPAKGSLEVYDLTEQKKETLVNGITDFEVSADGKVLVYRAGNRLRALPAGQKPEESRAEKGPGRESGWIDLGRVRVSVDPKSEWGQMYREAWRLMRDHFWIPDMAGVDWEKVYHRYLPLLEKVATRSEFSDLMWEMQGEMGTSHAYEIGGDYRPSPSWFQGHLGADFAWDEEAGCWRIDRIPSGDSWNEKECSPLAAPGLGLAPGDRILAVAGRKLGRDVPPGLPLVHQAGQSVTITVANEKGKHRRSVVVTTLSSEHSLRYRDWVEKNRAYVHEKTNGRAGYVHIPNMGPRGYAEFHRYFLAELRYDGLVVDVRFNGGGHVSQILLEKLLRKRVGYDTQRWGEPLAYPSEAVKGPMVGLTNERAGSDGDIFSHCFKLYGLGPLIGKRTWGGVVGIWPRHTLVDGTITTQPEFSFWFRDVGFGVENYGTDPDIEVEIRPQDHAAGKDPQLDRGIRELKRLLRERPPFEPDFSKRPDRSLPRLPRGV